VAGRDVHLTPKEFDVLLYMAQHPRKVLTHRAILNAVWGGASVEQNEYLRVFVGQLRKKLEVDASAPKYILTEPWVGYPIRAGGLTIRRMQPAVISQGCKTLGGHLGRPFALASC
jgi:two-component system, OmpR family, KDP operon response regulator KdpE